MSYKNNSIKKGQDVQFKAAQQRMQENFAAGRDVNYVEGRNFNGRIDLDEGEGLVENGNCKCIFRRVVQVTLVASAMGLAWYAGYNKMGTQLITQLSELAGKYTLAESAQALSGLGLVLETYLSQGMAMGSVYGVMAKEFLMNMNLQMGGKVALGVLLLLIGVHKAVANGVICLVKSLWRNISMTLVVAFFAVVVAYVPEVNRSAMPILRKVLEDVVVLMAKNQAMAQGMDFLRVNAKYIGVILLDFMIVGFFHKAYDSCFGGPFRGQGRRF